MEAVISQLVKQFEDGRVTRRQLIEALAGLALAAGGGSVAAAQTAAGFKTLNVDHLSYQATDYRRTRDFYAGVLGMTVANDDGKANCEVQFGEARGVGVRDRGMMSIHTLMAATGQAATTTPRIGIDHIGWKIDDWNTDRVRAELERRGLKPRLAPGGAIDTPNYVSFMVQDPDGVGVQISGIAKPGDSQYKGR
jgi:catechol 2,3-dioxygenase-like lactoylglutathione lyase family enzyme